MWVVTNRKKIVLYTMCTLLFCLAGVFQATDSLLPDFWHALFALSANTILIFLVGCVGRFTYTPNGKKRFTCIFPNGCCTNFVFSCS